MIRLGNDIMIDLHTHILPGIDDGAKNEYEARVLLSMLKEQGVASVVLTPHFYPHKQELSVFINKRREAFQLISDFDMEMILGSETYLTESLFSNDSIDDLCIGNTRYLLLEMPDALEWTVGTFQMIDKVICKYNVRPIIAHVEKYRSVQINRHKEKLFQEFADIGCLLQINVDSAVNRSTRAGTLKMIRNGWADYIGSDCHNLNLRPPHMHDFREIIERKFGADQMNLWNSLPK